MRWVIPADREQMYCSWNRCPAEKRRNVAWVAAHCTGMCTVWGGSGITHHI